MRAKCNLPPFFAGPGHLQSLRRTIRIGRKHVMRIPRAVKIIIAVVFAPIALMVMGVAGIFLYELLSQSCVYHTIDSLPSPARRLSVARIEKRCSNDVDDRPVMFALIQSGKRFREGDVFLTSKNYEGARSAPLSIFAKWIDDDNLLIAAPEGALLKSAPNKFGETRIQYGLYPIESGRTRDEATANRVVKEVHFDAKFKENHGIGLPGAGCELEVSARDEEYVDRLSVYLRAQTTFAVQALDRGKVVIHKGYSSYDFLITGRDDVEKPNRHATGADVPGFSAADGKSALSTYELNYPSMRAPAGTPMPKWAFGYLPNNPYDITSMVRRIRDGLFAVQVGYWLDNSVVVYSATPPIDRKPIDEFERCLNQNHILNVPRFGEQQ